LVLKFGSIAVTHLRTASLVKSVALAVMVIVVDHLVVVSVLAADLLNTVPFLPLVPHQLPPLKHLLLSNFNSPLLVNRIPTGV